VHLFVLVVISDTLNSSDCVLSCGEISYCIMSWEGCGRTWPWLNLRYYFGMYLEEMRQNAKKLSQDFRYEVQGLALEHYVTKNGGCSPDRNSRHLCS
jgi:hypothetical protein